MEIPAIPPELVKPITGLLMAASWLEKAFTHVLKASEIAEVAEANELLGDADQLDSMEQCALALSVWRNHMCLEGPSAAFDPSMLPGVVAVELAVDEGPAANADIFVDVAAKILRSAYTGPEAEKFRRTMAADGFAVEDGVAMSLGGMLLERWPDFDKLPLQLSKVEAEHFGMQNGHN